MASQGQQARFSVYFFGNAVQLCILRYTNLIAPHAMTSAVHVPTSHAAPNSHRCARLRNGSKARAALPLPHPLGSGALSPSPRLPTAHPPPSRAARRCRPTYAALPLTATASTWLFAGSTMYAVGLALLMVVAPGWSRTRQLLSSPACIAPLALAYGVLLAASWQPDTLSTILPGSWAEGLSGGFRPQFFPSLAGISSLFAQATTAASLWVHLLAVNLFAARSFFLDGERPLEVAYRWKPGSHYLESSL